MMQKECQQYQELLPWYVNGSLSPAQAQQVFLHVEQCPRCAAELRFLSSLQQHVQSEKIVAPMPVWSRLQQRLGKQQPARRSWSRSWIPLTAMAAVVAIVVVRMPSPADQAPAYRLLTSNVSSQSHRHNVLRVLPAVAGDAAAISRLISRIDGEIVAGPTPRGVYTLALRHDVADRDAFIETLRNNTDIDFVEWVDQP